MSEEILRVEGLMKTFATRPSLLQRARRRETVPVRAVDDVGFTLGRGEILGIAGESGSGKSTTARCLNRLVEPDGGTIVFDGIDVRALAGRELREVRRRIQMVFQDPYASLNPRMSIGNAILEAGRVHRQLGTTAPRQFVRERLDMVRLPESFADRRPRDLSGGQRQRVAIARALATDPEIIVADEAVSALDVSVQTEIVNLFLDLRDEMGLSIVFVSHQLPVLAALTDRIAVMRSGALVELATTRAIFEDPQHPYTQGLLAAHPHPRFQREPSP
ncbi:ABC transporter ATP-binding protein [Nocardioides marmoriginsengisoli]|uniref:Glutathione import ATP-binding protein GsiA n=1 Tax=Nocardioides marmoriginsengisoli TaxID=661483 RepID=A0A3N0CH11_9ACTN|nr:ATP-binding cassette domain-containing protein [Nocardioides marmoriginsengisoli]RNL62531.1 ABC transporter ATP-binding protein [Nocardioides marmoriginsengisoli]